MKSLQLVNLDIFQDDLLKNVTNFCIQSELEKVYFLDGCCMFCCDLKTREVSLCSHFDGTSEDGRDIDIIQMDYIIATQCVCFSNSKGDIIVYSTISDQVEYVGSVSSGLHSVGWSPDQEFLVLMTGENTFILMTNEFDPVVEKSLHPNEFGENSPVNVGWGSKETQFQGSAGKESSKVKATLTKPALPWDDHKHRVSWRSDGQCFATSVIDPVEGCRKIRIWSREADLMSTGELVNGLEHCLFWKPSGNLITCSQQAADKHRVIFFERNGLVHGEFRLPFQPHAFIIKELLWNSDASILALWGHGIEESNNFSVLLWTMSNYQWYLKQRLNFTSKDPEILYMFWDQNIPCKLHILCQEGYYFQYTWGWTVFHSLTRGDGNAVAAVTKGDDILVTMFGKMIIPPPLSSCSYKLPCSVNGICFAQHEGSADFMVALADGRIAFFNQGDSIHTGDTSENCNLDQLMKDGGFKVASQLYNISNFFWLKFEGGAAVKSSNVLPYHWTWFSKNKLLCIMPQRNSNSCDLFSMEVPESVVKSDNLTLRKLATIEEKVFRICSQEGKNTVVLVQNGRILMYKNDYLEPWMSKSGRELLLPQTLSVALCCVHEQEVLLALSDRYDLFCNETVLVSRCSSFHIHGEFLLITTCDNTLQCFFKSSQEDSEKGHHFQTVDEAVQRVEKGSKIVRSIPGRTEVILQTPRGNIEVVHPRLLVLSLICLHLDNLEFGEAFTLMKRHRIDMNLMYDHNPQKFLSNIDVVIDHLGSSVEINLFLASLISDDVSSGMYQMVYQVRPRATSVDIHDVNKVNVVCDAVRYGLEKKNDKKLFQALVTCYAKKHPPELDKALWKIKEMKGSVQNEASSIATADGALKLLLCLVDASELYNNALGTYDFEIALMVAEKSQMDPKQYIPFLNELKNLEEIYRKYKIDMVLRRHKKALLHISSCGDHFDECLQLIKNQRLYKDALNLFPSSSDNYKAIWQSYGDYLMEKRYYGDAGLAYTKSEDFEKALSAYLSNLDWQSYLWTLKKLNYPTLKNITLCRNMATKLKQNQQHLDAAILLESYVEDIEESIITLIEGQQWGNALCLMAKYDRTDIIETHLHAALKEHCESLNASLDQMCVEFISHNQRLKTIRSEKQKAEFICNDFADHHLDDDIFSDTCSVSSVTTSASSGKQLSGSLVTAKTGRSRRKQELKKYRLKEGSPNEDLAHLAALSEMITKVDQMKDNFYNTLKTLMIFNLDSKAEDLQRKMLNLCETIESELPNIWQPRDFLHYASNYGPCSTSNSIVAERLVISSNHQNKECGIPRPEWRSGVPLRVTFLD